MHTVNAAGLALAAALATAAAPAAPIFVANGNFEDDYNGGAVPAGGFPTGPAPNGWTIHDPNAVVGVDSFVGVLNPGGTAFFPGGTPEGSNAALLYSDGAGAGALYGISQVLGATLQAGTAYTLDVEVGNIASGTGLGAFAGFGFYDLDGFPGYAVQLLAGGTLLAEDVNGVSPAEGQFETASVQFTPDGSHAALLGQALEVRLINLHGAGAPGARGVEVDFDDVRLDGSAVAATAPGTTLLAGLGLAALGFTGRRRARAPAGGASRSD